MQSPSLLREVPGAQKRRLTKPKWETGLTRTRLSTTGNYYNRSKRRLDRAIRIFFLITSFFQGIIPF